MKQWYALYVLLCSYVVLVFILLDQIQTNYNDYILEIMTLFIKG